MSDPRLRLVFLVVLAGCIVSGCGANKPTPPLPPSSSAVYDQEWAVVPVRPSELNAEGREKHRRMIEEVRESLSDYDHPFTLYSTVDDGMAGVSADTLYRSAQDEEEKRPFNEEVLQQIRDQTGTRTLFLVRADRQDQPDSDGARRGAGRGCGEEGRNGGAVSPPHGLSDQRHHAKSGGLSDAEDPLVATHHREGRRPCRVVL
jgi:hypothetical protein